MSGSLKDKLRVCEANLRGTEQANAINSSLREQEEEKWHILYRLAFPEEKPWDRIVDQRNEQGEVMVSHSPYSFDKLCNRLKAERPEWMATVRKYQDRFPITSSPLEERVRFFVLAICGEAGELANIIKKQWRGDGIGLNSANVQEEIVDIRIYLQILAETLQIDLDAACTAKAKVCLERWGAKRGAK